MVGSKSLVDRFYDKGKVELLLFVISENRKIGQNKRNKSKESKMKPHFILYCLPCPVNGNSMMNRLHLFELLIIIYTNIDKDWFKGTENYKDKLITTKKMSCIKVNLGNRRLMLNGL